LLLSFASFRWFLSLFFSNHLFHSIFSSSRFPVRPLRETQRPEAGLRICPEGQSFAAEPFVFRAEVGVCFFSHAFVAGE
jgi:hypothetical protein